MNWHRTNALQVLYPCCQQSRVAAPAACPSLHNLCQQVRCWPINQSQWCQVFIHGPHHIGLSLLLQLCSRPAQAAHMSFIREGELGHVAPCQTTRCLAAGRLAQTVHLSKNMKRKCLFPFALGANRTCHSFMWPSSEKCEGMPSLDV
jgi:hypothetical protein